MLANLRSLFARLIDIMLLRRGPETLPASPALLTIIVALNVVLNALVIHILIVPMSPPGQAAGPFQVALGALLTLLWWRVAFQLAGKPERFIQTMIAVFSATTLLIPASPLFAAMMPYMHAKPGAEPPPVALQLLIVVIGSWMLAVMTRIVRAAFEWPWPACILFVFASGLGPLFLLAIFSGEPPKPT